MKAIMSNKKIMLSVLALMLVLTATIGTTLAYFTTFTSAEGRHPISLGTTTTTTEIIDGVNKEITITNSNPGNDAYIRVKAFYGSDADVTMVGSDWKQGEDGWWYYNKILAPGETTSMIKAFVEIKEDAADKFDIVVVHESIQAFDPSVSAIDANWDDVLDIEGGDK